MTADRLQKLEDRVQFLQREAELFKRQSYEQADLLLELVPPLTRLAQSGNAAAVGAAMQLARGVGNHGQDVDAIRALADEFLDVYRRAQDAGQLLPHGEALRAELAEVLAGLPVEAHLLELALKQLRGGSDIAASLAPVVEALRGGPAQAAHAELDGRTRERLAAMVVALPLEQVESQRAHRLGERLRGDGVDMQALGGMLGELAALLELALQGTETRNQQMQRLVEQMSGELSAVEGFLGALDKRDDDSLASALAAQADVGAQSDGIASVFEHCDSLDAVKGQVLECTRSIRARMDRYAADAQEQRRQAALESADLTGRLTALEGELQNTRAALAEARECASHDHLTGLYNRAAYEERMKLWLAEARAGAPLCCVIWDIDYFKLVNDNHGHLVGDRVLQAVAATLEARVGERDLAARLGGEEFVTVVRGVQAKSVLLWADAVREQVAALAHETESDPIQVSVSCGIAEYQRGDSLVSIMVRADKALYNAKHQGRNCCQLAA